MGEVQLASRALSAPLGSPSHGILLQVAGRTAKFEVVPFLELYVWTIFPQNTLLLIDPTSGCPLPGVQEP